jgi:glycopeptide antibiotics resistance protein
MLAIPVMLIPAVFFMRLAYKNPKLRLSKVKVFFACAYVAISFELLIPLYNDYYKADWLDVVMYFLGGGIFVMLNRDLIKNQKKIDLQGLPQREH